MCEIKVKMTSRCKSMGKQFHHMENTPVLVWSRVHSYNISETKRCSESTKCVLKVLESLVKLRHDFPHNLMLILLINAMATT